MTEPLAAGPANSRQVSPGQVNPGQVNPVPVSPAPQTGLGMRALLLVMATGLLCAAGGFGLAAVALSFQEPRYRAETQLALLPGPFVPPQEIADSWEALNRGQAARIAAEVLGQRRWQAAAARSAGVPVETISVTAGAVADTSLIEVGVEASSPQAAEQAAATVVREARPVVEQVSGLFALEILQAPEGTATPVGTPPGQLLAVASAAGLLIGSGAALMLLRYRAARGATPLIQQPPAQQPPAQQPPAQQPPAQQAFPLQPPAQHPGTLREAHPDQYFEQYPEERLPRRVAGPPISPPHGVMLPNRPPSWPGSAAAPSPSGPQSPSAPTRR